MEVNERVMTMLCSSAGVSVRLCEAIWPSGGRVLQLMARVRIFRSTSSHSAALRISEVAPERDMRTGRQAFGFGASNSG